MIVAILSLHYVNEKVDNITTLTNLFENNFILDVGIKLVHSQEKTFVQKCAKSLNTEAIILTTAFI